MAKTAMWHGSRKEVQGLSDALTRWAKENPSHPAVTFLAKVMPKLYDALACEGDRVAFEAPEAGVKALVSFGADNGIGNVLFLHRALTVSSVAEGV